MFNSKLSIQNLPAPYAGPAGRQGSTFFLLVTNHSKSIRRDGNFTERIRRTKKDPCDNTNKIKAN
ncbi:MAG: hypothetical protein ACYC6P_14950 [Ignavibacteriaceae bacterium]